MGQRLVIDLIHGGETVAAIYYHWSAYFASTIGELARLSEVLLKKDKESDYKEKLLSIIEELETETEHQTMYSGIEKRRGGVRGYAWELEYAQKMFPQHEFQTENVNRNEGIISFTKEGIEEFHVWMEGYASIDLDTYEICNSVWYEPYPFEIGTIMTGLGGSEDGYIESPPEVCHVSINGKTCLVDAFDCTCEEIIDLCNFMEKEYDEYRKSVKD